MEREQRHLDRESGGHCEEDPELERLIERTLGWKPIGVRQVRTERRHEFGIEKVSTCDF